jgi:hypothetical protein
VRTQIQNASRPVWREVDEVGTVIFGVKDDMVDRHAFVGFFPHRTARRVDVRVARKDSNIMAERMQQRSLGSGR